MKLGALLNWSDPAADFKAATAKIAPERFAANDDGGPVDEAGTPIRHQPVDKVKIGGKEVVETPMLPAPGQMRDVRAMSPRELSEFAHELYIEGVIKWDEYKTLGFPTELNRQYADTIGALTGEKAEPDKPRDMINEWEDRLNFEKKYFADDAVTPARTQKVLNVLKWHEIPKVSLEI